MGGISPAVRVLQEAESALKVDIDEATKRFEAAQKWVAEANEHHNLVERAVDQLKDELLAVQEGIEDLYDAEQAREAANRPDSPTNIPDHAIPWTPLDPAEPIEGEPNE